MDKKSFEQLQYDLKNTTINQAIARSLEIQKQKQKRENKKKLSAAIASLVKKTKPSYMAKP